MVTMRQPWESICLKTSTGIQEHDIFNFLHRPQSAGLFAIKDVHMRNFALLKACLCPFRVPCLCPFRCLVAHSLQIMGTLGHGSKFT